MIVTVLLLAGCAGAGNYAPVRSYYRDIPKAQKYYTVKKGDTLYAIGFRSGHGYRRLAAWNKLSPPYRIFVGQKIKLFKSKQKLRTSKKKPSVNRGVAKTRNTSQKNLRISNDKKKVLKLYWQWPIQGKILKSFSQTGNKGIDIGGKLGQSVKAAAGGKVVYSGHGLVGYGNLLIIKHSSLYLSAYGHNRRLLVKEGQVVKKGQTIAEVGKAGGSQTSLHFEIRRKGKPVNPMRYLPKK
ncbi:peptidoglycan DD-metalloendopeptidase family protein [Methylomarinum sp. Ch1-1]|uniref:Peptidoglycan DD-metalloendopeptidase family protein n=1 Tax=Methylomarinum roseum TaxID=3067653 RepID=A0AAU7NQ80_9GAMM